LATAQIKSPLDRQRLSHIPEGKGIRYQIDETTYLKGKLRLNIDWQSLPENRFRQTKFQRIDRKTPAPTIMTHRHSYYHPTEDRYLTAREAAKLQSFPNDFIFQGPLSAQWRQIGNAVPPLLGKSIAGALNQMFAQATLGGKKKSSSKVVAKTSISEQINHIRSNAFHYRQKVNPAKNNPEKNIGE
jgi:DNA (cytosine-5)-methyltransferase 1